MFIGTTHYYSSNFTKTCFSLNVHMYVLRNARPIRNFRPLTDERKFVPLMFNIKLTHKHFIIIDTIYYARDLLYCKSRRITSKISLDTSSFPLTCVIIFFLYTYIRRKIDIQINGTF